ncbi:MAG: hypothetical protein APF77_07000 [Clostridia bacterium BRH_c25]|nr:MAG: hypothetical protein APF77_07000 [Clostridia bacterium BRH_c25]
MHNIIMVTHGAFAEGIKSSAELILGEQGNVFCVSVTEKETVSEVQAMIEEKITAFDQHNPIAVLTDIIGGSTTQAAIKCISNHEQLYLISGLNLGLLLEIITLDLDSDAAGNVTKLNQAINVSRNAIYLVNEAVGKNSDDLGDEL